jgi:DNA-binding transcriptional LysR family regulator
MLENFHLRVFRTVAEQLSFRKAGEKLYLTQPAVTLQIKTLEEQLALKLFNRNASGVDLTEAGKTLLEYACRLAALAEEAENELAAASGEAAGELTLGASTTIAQYVLPPALAEFARRYPAIHLQVASQNTEHIAAGVASGRFALGLIEGPPMRRDLKIESWFDDEMVVVTPHSHEWAAQSSITAEDLLTVPLVMRERGSGSRHVVEQALQKAGLRLGKLKIAMELDSTEAILSCIESGLGVGFASVWALNRHGRRESLMQLRLAGQSITRAFSFALPAAPTLSAPAAALKQFLQEHHTQTRSNNTWKTGNLKKTRTKANG